MNAAEVILVDEHDTPIGTMEKMAAHSGPYLHRAFSVFLFNQNGDMLLQKRSAEKYHCAGLWTNTCCSHPMPGELVADAARRRLVEEMGISEVVITKAFDFTYTADLPNGLVECEFDHVFIGQYDGPIVPTLSEVEAFEYVPLHKLLAQVQTKPQAYTPWFLIALPQVQARLPHLPWQNVRQNTAFQP